MSLNSPCCPWLPTELIEKIVSEVWSSPLTAEERITLMLSSTLVNKTWSIIFNRVSFKEVHIPCPSYLHQYFRILRKESFNFDEEQKSFSEDYCRSINLMVDHTLIHPSPPRSYKEPAMGKVLSNLAYMLATLSYLPNLRIISVEYRNVGFDDLFDNLRFISFPQQVTDLELKFSFSPLTPPWLIGALRSTQTRQQCIKWSLPSIRRLSIIGGSEPLIADMVSICPKLEVLQLDVPFKLGVVGNEAHLVTLHELMVSSGKDESMYSLLKVIIASDHTSTDTWYSAYNEGTISVQTFRRHLDP